MKRACIVGKGPGRHYAPREKTKNCRIWGINDVVLEQYVDVIWDMHNLDWTEEECRENYYHLKGLFPEEEIERRVKNRMNGWKNLKMYCNHYKKPIMSLKKYDDIPVSYAYPLRQVINRFDSDYFTCTVTYAIAYALYKDFDSIECFGIGAVVGEEWEYQRSSVSHWLGVAKGMGKFIAVTGPEGRPLRLAHGLLYGYNTPQMERGIKCTDSYLDHIQKKRFIADVWKES